MLMKRFIYAALCFICILVLAACGKKQTLFDDIASVDITADGNTVSYSDKTWIREIISDISAAEPTGKESVQDIPKTENYIKIVLNTATGAGATLYAYEDAYGFFIEQPYQGIYKTDSELYERLHMQK